MEHQISSSFFDTYHERRGTGSAKWSKDAGFSAGERIPMWIADMDFKAPPEVEAALERAAKEAIFGYVFPEERFKQTVAEWFKNEHNWEFETSAIYMIPTVIYGMVAALRAFSEPGESVLIFEPVYHPFRRVVEGNKRKLIVSELVETNGRYEIDFEDFETKVRENQVKALIFCSPHNPVGRVWTRDEIQKVGDICEAYDVKLIVDEIHSDFYFEGHKHTAFPTVSQKIADRTVVLTAPTKTFNLAGIQGANLIATNESLRRRCLDEGISNGYYIPNTLSLIATDAAYKHCAYWAHELRQYLQGNLALVREALDGLTEVSLIEPEGTYLIWLDFRQQKIPAAEWKAKLSQGAGLWLNEGEQFGNGGAGFMRMNIACPRSTLQTALERLVREFK